MPKSLYPKKKRDIRIPPIIPLLIIVIVLLILAIALAIACTSPYNMAWA